MESTYWRLYFQRIVRLSNGSHNRQHPLAFPSDSRRLLHPSLSRVFNRGVYPERRTRAIRDQTRGIA